MRAEAAVEATDSWRRLRALAIGAREGWFGYVAGDLGAGRHLLQVGDRLREIQRDETFGWAHGVAAANGKAHLLDDLGLVPPLVSIEQAARDLGITTDGVDYRIAAGKLYPLYLARARGGRERHLFAAQVRAAVPGRGPKDEITAWEAGRDEAAAEWLRIRAQLPPTTRIVDMPDYAGPAPSPSPLPLPSGPAESIRCMNALIIGDGEGWFEYVHGDPGAGRYLVSVLDNGDDREMTIPGDDVLPWVLGHGDVHGHPELVAYREGLG